MTKRSSPPNDASGRAAACRARARRDRGPAAQPSARSFSACASRFGHVDARGDEQRVRLGVVQRERRRARARAARRSARSFGSPRRASAPPGQHELRALRDVGEQGGERVEALVVLELVDVVEHEHERLTAATASAEPSRGRPLGQSDPPPGDRLEHRRPDRLHRRSAPRRRRSGARRGRCRGGRARPRRTAGRRVPPTGRAAVVLP